jgi:hypothetical protein
MQLNTMCKSSALVQRQKLSEESSSFEEEVKPRTSEMRFDLLLKEESNKSRNGDRQQHTTSYDQPTEPSNQRQNSQQYTKDFLTEDLPDLETEIAEEFQQLESFLDDSILTRQQQRQQEHEDKDEDGLFFATNSNSSYDSVGYCYNKRHHSFQDLARTIEEKFDEIEIAFGLKKKRTYSSRSTMTSTSIEGSTRSAAKKRFKLRHSSQKRYPSFSIDSSDSKVDEILGRAPYLSNDYEENHTLQEDIIAQQENNEENHMELMIEDRIIAGVQPNKIPTAEELTSWFIAYKWRASKNHLLLTNNPRNAEIGGIEDISIRGTISNATTGASEEEENGPSSPHPERDAGDLNISRVLDDNGKILSLPDNSHIKDIKKTEKSHTAGVPLADDGSDSSWTAPPHHNEYNRSTSNSPSAEGAASTHQLVSTGASSPTGVSAPPPAVGAVEPNKKLLRDLICPSSRRLVTTFINEVMDQMELTTFATTDKRGNRSKIPIGFPGLSCLHCQSDNCTRKSGRYFPTSLRTLSNQTTLLVMYTHLLSCGSVSEETKEHLELLYAKHLQKENEQKKKLLGSRISFFNGIWTSCLQHKSDTPLKDSS